MPQVQCHDFKAKCIPPFLFYAAWLEILQFIWNKNSPSLKICWFILLPFLKRLTLVTLMLFILHLNFWMIWLFIIYWVHIEDRGGILMLALARMHSYVVLRTINLDKFSWNTDPLEIWQLLCSFWSSKLRTATLTMLHSTSTSELPVQSLLTLLLVPGARKISWCNQGVMRLLLHLPTATIQDRWQSAAFLDAISPKLLEKAKVLLICSPKLQATCISVHPHGTMFNWMLIHSRKLSIK